MLLEILADNYPIRVVREDGGVMYVGYLHGEYIGWRQTESGKDLWEKFTGEEAKKEYLLMMMKGS